MAHLSKVACWMSQQPGVSRTHPEIPPVIILQPLNVACLSHGLCFLQQICTQTTMRDPISCRCQGCACAVNLRHRDPPSKNRCVSQAETLNRRCMYLECRDCWPGPPPELSAPEPQPLGRRRRCPAEISLSKLPAQDPVAWLAAGGPPGLPLP